MSLSRSDVVCLHSAGRMFRNYYKLQPGWGAYPKRARCHVAIVQRDCRSDSIGDSSVILLTHYDGKEVWELPSIHMECDCSNRTEAWCERVIISICRGQCIPLGDVKLKKIPYPLYEKAKMNDGTPYVIEHWLYIAECDVSGIPENYPDSDACPYKLSDYSHGWKRWYLKHLIDPPYEYKSCWSALEEGSLSARVRHAPAKKPQDLSDKLLLTDVTSIRNPDNGWLGVVPIFLGMLYAYLRVTQQMVMKSFFSYPMPDIVPAYSVTGYDEEAFPNHFSFVEIGETYRRRSWNDMKKKIKPDILARIEDLVPSSAWNTEAVRNKQGARMEMRQMVDGEHINYVYSNVVFPLHLPHEKRSMGNFGNACFNMDSEMPSYLTLNGKFLGLITNRALHRIDGNNSIPSNWLIDAPKHSTVCASLPAFLVFEHGLKLEERYYQKHK